MQRTAAELNRTIAPVKSEKPASPTAAERMADTRLRRKFGFECLTLEVHKDETAKLIEAGYLEAAACNDKSAKKGALAEFLELFFAQPNVADILKNLRREHLRREASSKEPVVVTRPFEGEANMTTSANRSADLAGKLPISLPKTKQDQSFNYTRVGKVRLGS